MSTTLEQALRRDRVIVVAGLALISILSWAYLLWLGDDMGGTVTAGAAMAPRIEPWTAAEFGLMFLMWAVMMVAMMTPSAAPVILLFARIYRRQRPEGALGPTVGFTAGYLLAWTGFSALATALQWGLEQAALVSPMSMATGRAMGGILLVTAGLYQLTPIKDRCLEHCRSPVHFIAHHFRPGRRGALRMGLEHGLFCIGCCGFLMGLLFVGGVMNLLWIAGIAIFVLLEKVVPGGVWVARMSGILMIVVGVVVGLGIGSG